MWFLFFSFQCFDEPTLNSHSYKASSNHWHYTPEEGNQNTWIVLLDKYRVNGDCYQKEVILPTPNETTTTIVPMSTIKVYFCARFQLKCTATHDAGHGSVASILGNGHSFVKYCTYIYCPDGSKCRGLVCRTTCLTKWSCDVALTSRATHKFVVKALVKLKNINIWRCSHSNIHQNVMILLCFVCFGHLVT